MLCKYFPSPDDESPATCLLCGKSAKEHAQEHERATLEKEPVHYSPQGRAENGYREER